MDVKAIRRALPAAARTVVDSTGIKLEALHYSPGAIDPPFLFPSETDGNYHDTTDGSAGMVVTLRVLTSRAEDQAGQELLDDFLADEGATSIKAALEADPTLGGLCDDLIVQGWSGYRPYEHADTPYYGAELTVVILA